MRLKSRGLGRKELVMDFREYEIVREGDEIVVVGTIRDPVIWDFSIRICEDDLAGLLATGLKGKMLSWLLRAAFKRNKAHHWPKDRAEHVAEGKERRKAAAVKARARAQAAKESPRPSAEVRARVRRTVDA